MTKAKNSQQAAEKRISDVFASLPPHTQAEIIAKSGTVARDENHPRNATARYDYLTQPNNQTPSTSFIYFDPKYTFLGIERMRSYAEAVYFQQNDAIVATVLEDHANAVVGAKGGKIKISYRTKTWADEASDYINNWWSDNCDWHELKNSFNDFLWLTDVIANRDGDCLWVCDAAITSGKIMLFEADQIVDNQDFGEWEGLDKVKATQHDGIVFNDKGQCIGVFCTTQRQKKAVPAKDCLFVPIDSCFVFIGTPYRANQHRGDSKLLCLLQVLQHNRKMLESTVISAQRQAEDIAVMKCKQPLSALLSLEQRGAIGVPSTPPTYTPIGGGQVNIGPEDDYKVLTNNKPEREITEFGDFYRKVVYKRFGMSNSMASGTVDSSDQGKAEMILTHQAISTCQQRLSKLVRWVVRKAIEAAVEAGDLKAPATPWYKIDCLWPILPTAEFDQTQADRIARIRTGGSSFEAEFGPEWIDTIQEYANELDWLRKNGMEHLDVFSTVAGKSVELDKEKKPQETKKNDDVQTA